VQVTILWNIDMRAAIVFVTKLDYPADGDFRSLITLQICDILLRHKVL